MLHVIKEKYSRNIQWSAPEGQIILLELLEEFVFRGSTRKERAEKQETHTRANAQRQLSR